MSRAASTLAETRNYRLLLELHPCDAMPSSVHLRISSWYTDAKDPNSPQVRFQSLVAVDALVGMKQAIEAALAQPTHTVDQGGGAACG